MTRRKRSRARRRYNRQRRSHPRRELRVVAFELVPVEWQRAWGTERAGKRLLFMPGRPSWIKACTLDDVNVFDSLFGTWPGDESDAEVVRALADL